MKRSTSQTEVAIVGMACRLPGGDNLPGFWQSLREGRSSVAPLTADRFPRDLLYHPEKGVPHKTYSDLACTVDYSRFRRAWNYPADVANNPEITYLTLCDLTAEAFQHAGWNPGALPNQAAGVYVGHTRCSGISGKLVYGSLVEQTAQFLRETPGFNQLTPAAQDAAIRQVVAEVRRQGPQRDNCGGPELGASVASRLIAAAYGLSGPVMSFNSACASSLQALASAVRAIQLGRISQAVVGGASYCHPDTFILFSQAQSLSATGTRPFDANADGLIIGEGCVVMILKALDKALADGDPIQAVIRGVGMSSDGKGKSLWAPRREGQIEAVRRAYQHGADMAGVQYIEAHATSTQVGDATEVGALAEVMAAGLPAGVKIPIGSVKANIGHTLETAGLAGLLKTVLAMQHGYIPPAIGITQLNPKIDWDNSPFYVPTTGTAWPEPADGQPRRAGINAFGIGGLNLHVVIDQTAPQAATRRSYAGNGSANGAHTSNGASHASSQAPYLVDIPHPDTQSVAIVGLGAVLPGARTAQALSELFTSHRDARSSLPDNRWQMDLFLSATQDQPWKFNARTAGIVHNFEYDWKRHKIPPKQLAHANPLQFMILDAVDQAIQQSGYDQKPFDRKQVGVIVGTNFGGEFSNQLQMALRLPDFQQTLAGVLRQQGQPEDLVQYILEEYPEVFLKHMPALLDETGSFTASSMASRITKSFDLMGGATAVDASNHSAPAALMCCVDMLLSGDCEMMVCVSGAYDLTPARFEAMARLGQLQGDLPPAPFDQAASGSVPAEGCGVFLLKRLADARRDGDNVLGIIRGVEAARGNTRHEAVQNAVRHALNRAALSPSDVAAVDVCATGVPQVDAEELLGLSHAYQTRQRQQPLVVGTPVGQIGHLGWAVGIASMLRATLAVQSCRMPGTVGLNHVSESLGMAAAKLQASAAELPFPLTQPQGRVLAGVSTSTADVAYHVIIERGTPVSLPSPIPANRIIHFDATERRRERMRQLSQRGRSAPVAEAPAAEAPVAVAPISPPVPVYSAPVVPAPVAVAPVVPAPQAPAPAPVAVKAGPKPEELETFLVNFVVEQTGYPAEIVELDADMEADLGIDSIKKAQLFGDLREFFDIAPRAGLTLDDFLTLRDVLNFLRDTSPAAPAAVAPEPIAAKAEYKPGSNGHGSHSYENHHAAFNGAEKWSPILPAPLPESITPITASSPAPVAVKAGPKPEELETFLVNFVVEQTGYPAEIVELDADMEADLGIDSIKKAQLFGDLREYFDIAPRAGLTLDDFLTLRDVLNFLQTATPTSAPAVSAPVAITAPVVSAPVLQPANVSSLAPVKAGPQPGELESFLVNFVVEQTGYPAEIVELDADMEADLGIDSIKKAQLFGDLREYFDIAPRAGLTLDDFLTLRDVLNFLQTATPTSSPAAPPAPVAAPPVIQPAAPAAPLTYTTNGTHHVSPAAPVPAASGPNLDELESFLVNFVVEQTGYPAEIVELDADMEADLGIDSIKKAQLFGDLREYFDIAPRAGLTLDDFLTLRDVLNFLQTATPAANAPMTKPR